MTDLPTEESSTAPSSPRQQRWDDGEWGNAEQEKIPQSRSGARQLALRALYWESANPGQVGEALQQLGEACGLTPKLRTFAEQVATARQRDLPVSIHVRGDEPNAFDEMLEIWRSEGGGALEGVLHCYTGSLDFARRAIDTGFYVSFSGILTFKRDRGLRDVARALPLERLMVETDAPLLAPEGHRGRRNEPKLLSLVGETLAAVKGLPAAEVARATIANARRLFRLEAA